MRLKLGPHYLPGGEALTQQWLQLKPAVAKFCYQFDLAKDADPNTLRVGRPDENFIGQHPLLSGDPLALARQMAQEVYAPLIAAHPAIDAWEGPNEIGCNPDQVAEMQWYSAFLGELGKQIQLLGKRACLGAWSVGSPELSLWQHYVPVLRACRDYGAILSRHAYGPLDQWYSFRHRQDEATFQQLGFAGTPLIISECGADRLGNFPGPWRKVWGDRVEGYWQDYLLHFTQELEKDEYVLGATLFTVGTGFSEVWRNFDVADTRLVDLIAGYAQTLPPDVPPGAGYPYSLYRVNAQKLNVRLYPWTGESVPQVVRQLAQGEQVQVFGIYKPEGMTYGWGALSPDSNEWVNMHYLDRLAGPAQASPGRH